MHKLKTTRYIDCYGIFDKITTKNISFSIGFVTIFLLQRMQIKQLIFDYIFAYLIKKMLFMIL
jgi:hypothetical protein